MEDKLFDNILHHTENILPAVAGAFPEQSKRITKFMGNLQKKKPEIAKGLVVASVLCKYVFILNRIICISLYSEHICNA